MINRNNLKQKYKSEFDRQENYDVILNKAEKRNAPYRLVATMATLILVILFVPKQFSKSADNVMIFDEYAAEIGPEIALNINQSADDMKYDGTLPSLRADMEMKHQPLEEMEIMADDICPENFVSSAPVRFSITNKGNGNEESSYEYIHFSNENKTIQVAYSKKGYPFRDYVLSPDEAVSILDGVEVKITQHPDMNLYLCIFELNGYYFDIETSQISEAKLVDFLLNLIEKVRQQDSNEGSHIPKEWWRG